MRRIRFTWASLTGSGRYCPLPQLMPTSVDRASQQGRGALDHPLPSVRVVADTSALAHRSRQSGGGVHPIAYVPPWPSPLPDEPVERDDYLDRTLVGSESEEDGKAELKKTVRDGDPKKTHQEEHARSGRLQEDKFKPAPTGSNGACRCAGALRHFGPPRGGFAIESHRGTGAAHVDQVSSKSSMIHSLVALIRTDFPALSLSVGRAPCRSSDRMISRCWLCAADDPLPPRPVF